MSNDQNIHLLLNYFPGVRDKERVHADGVEHGADGVDEDELVVLVVLGVVLPQVGEEVAGVHPVEAVEEGVEADLHVHLLDLRQALDVLVPPGGDAAAKTTFETKVLCHMSKGDTDIRMRANDTT